MRKSIFRLLIRAIVFFIIFSIAGVVIFRFVPVWMTPYMVSEKIRALGAGEDSELQKKMGIVRRDFGPDGPGGDSC